MSTVHSMLSIVQLRNTNKEHYVKLLESLMVAYYVKLLESLMVAYYDMTRKLTQKME
jgi:hypothetical protein